MKYGPLLLLLLLAGIASAQYDMELIEYYGTGCPHCSRMEAVIEDSVSTTYSEYDINIIKKEVYFNDVNRQELLKLFIRFGMDPSVRVPITLVDNRSLIIGETNQERFEEIMDEHLENESVAGVYTQLSFEPVINGISRVGTGTQLTLIVLLGAALVDSINPCTITVMVLLLGVILMADGKNKMLLAAITFITVIFFSYLLMGLGILTAISNTGLVTAFYYVVTAAALLLAIMEFNAYLRYKPGFFSVEMPMFMRPYLKKVMKSATSIPGVAVAAFVCSLFLLPCSSGPYLMVLSMIAESVTVQALLYLVLYNLIFIIPMAIIAGAVYLGRTTVEEIGDMREKYIRQIHLFSGLILFALFVVMLGKILGAY